MIKINFSSAISIYLFLSLLLVFVLWIFYNCYTNGARDETQYVQQCPYCTYIFFNHGSGAEESAGTNGEEISKAAGAAAAHPSEAGESRGQKASLLICPRCGSYIHLENHHQDKKG